MDMVGAGSGRRFVMRRWLHGQGTDGDSELAQPANVNDGSDAAVCARPAPAGRLPGRGICGDAGWEGRIGRDGVMFGLIVADGWGGFRPFSRQMVDFAGKSVWGSA